MSYALTTFSVSGGPHQAGLVLDDGIVALRQLADHLEASQGQLLPGASVLSLVEDWQHSEALLEKLAGEIRGGLPVVRHAPVDVQIHAPIENPRQIFCTGANYRKHVVQLTLDMKVGPEGLQGDALRRWAEDMMDERARAGEPYAFTKPVSAVAGPFDTLKLPESTKMPDWEIELGVVIGARAWQVPRERALEHVAGYAVVNDITARDLIARTDYKMLGTDWLRSKGQPGFLPFGPYLVPARFVPNPQNLRLRLCVNGRTMQDESTADMLFDVARQIEYLSRHAVLLPGDLICTGSPAGNGTHYGRYLQPGDLMTAEIDGLGQQRVRCVAAGDKA